MKNLMIAASALLAGTANAQVQNLPPEQKKEFNDIAVAFVMASECSKRFEMPEIFPKATDAFLKVAMKYDMPNARAEVKKSAAELKSKPLPEGGFTLATPTSCQKIEANLTAYLSE